jgi:hypothetical protein
VQRRGSRKAKREKRSGKAAAARRRRRPTDKPACRPCDQPHFFLADSKDAKIERALLVADYPVKDWKTNKPKPLVATKGEQYVVTGTFAINSITGFAASNGPHHPQEVRGLRPARCLAEGNAVLPARGPDHPTSMASRPQPVGSAAAPQKK